MAPTLNIEGKRILLEQGLKQGFPSFKKILLAQRSFINIARLNSMYRFGMRIGQDDTYVWFENRSGKELTEKIPMKLEMAQRLFRLLSPSVFVSNDYTYEQKNIVEFLEGSSSGISITCYSGSDISPDLIGRIWTRIVEMKLYAYQLAYLECLPPKSFDKLEVCGILSSYELQQALRHDVKNLIFPVRLNLFKEADLIRIQNFIAARIGRCTVKIEKWESRESTLAFLQSLVGVLRLSLTHLDVDITPHVNFVSRRSVQNLPDDVEWLEKTASIFNEANTILTIKFVFRYEFYGKEFKLDCISNKPHMRDIQSMTDEASSRNHLSLKRKIGKVDIEFHAIVDVLDVSLD